MPVIPPQPSRHPEAASDERLYQRLQFRQDTLANWLKNDPILASGEMGYVIGATEEDRRLKVGDGTRRWSELPWVASRGPSGPAGPQGPQGPGPIVYKQTVQPAAPDLKDGDVWLQPIDASGAPVSMAAVQEEILRAIQVMRTEVTNEVTNTTTVTESVSREVVAEEVAKQLAKLPPSESLVTAADSTEDLRASIAALEKSVNYIQNDFLTDPSNEVATQYKEELVEIVRTILNGGVKPPVDRPWTECPKVAGAGLVEARVVNGILQLRGTITITTSGWVHVRNLPQYFPAPKVEYATVVTGGETGIAERVCQVLIAPNGQIKINPFGQKITFINTYPARAEVS